MLDCKVMNLACFQMIRPSERELENIAGQMKQQAEKLKAANEAQGPVEPSSQERKKTPLVSQGRRSKWQDGFKI
jgi:hypothetical protein